MKRIGTILTVAAVAALALSAQAFAFGGGIGGGHMGGNMGGGHQMSSGMQGDAGPAMRQGAMNGAGPQHMAMNETGVQGMAQGSARNTATTPRGQMHGSGTGMTGTKTPPSTTTH